MENLEAAAPRAETVNLQLLGIQTERPPGASLPAVFNPMASKAWEEALKSDEYSAVKSRKGATTMTKWDAMVGLFLGACRRQKVYPFASPNSDVANSKFANSLEHARRTLVSFLNSSGLLKMHTVKTVDFQYTFNPGNTVIKARATCNSLADPTMPKLLDSLGFLRRADLGKNAVAVSLQANVEVRFYEAPKSKSIIEYVISVHPAIVYTSKLDTRLPSKKKMTSFLENKFIRPVIKKYPIKSVKKPF